jgi:hypothetical protein
MNCTVTIADGVEGLVGLVPAAKAGRDTVEEDTFHMISKKSCVSASTKKFIAAMVSAGEPEPFLEGMPKRLLDPAMSTPFCRNHTLNDSVELLVF